MVNHEESRKEKLNINYDIFGIIADFSQLARALHRGEMKGKQKTIDQIIKKLTSVSKRI